MNLSQRTEFCFASNYFIFLKILFQLRTSYNDLIWSANNPNTHIRTFVSAGILFDGTFSLWVSLN